MTLARGIVHVIWVAIAIVTTCVTGTDTGTVPGKGNETVSETGNETVPGTGGGTSGKDAHPREMTGIGM